MPQTNGDQCSSDDVYSRRSPLLSDIPPRPFPTYDELNPATFISKHVHPNTPFLLSEAATSAWPAREHWANRQAEAGPSRPRESAARGAAPSQISTPNLTALRAYADQVVPVANTAAREFSEFERDELPLGDVLDRWEKGEGGVLYVKDWHLVAELEARGRRGDEVYRPPPCFLDDWLSPPFDGDTTVQPASSTSCADFRFVYMGPAGTFTPLHRDVYGSYSWSANIVGRKVWWLFPPGVEKELVDEHDNLLFDVRGHPNASKGIKVLQQEGEVIFVPSGWHHQVVNVDFCISINHNFFASTTLPRVYAALRANHARCADSIEDVQADIRARLGDDACLEDGTRAWEAEWAAEVDGLLARDAGWGWAGFWGCVRDNLVRPPAPPHCSAPREERNAAIDEVVRLYKASPEWRLLPDVRPIVDTAEKLLLVERDGDKLWARLPTAEADIAEAEEEVTQLECDVKVAEKRKTEAEAHKGNLANRVKTAEADVAKARRDGDTLAKRVKTAEARGQHNSIIV